MAGNLKSIAKGWGASGLKGAMRHGGSVAAFAGAGALGSAALGEDKSSGAMTGGIVGGIMSSGVLGQDMRKAANFFNKAGANAINKASKGSSILRANKATNPINSTLKSGTQMSMDLPLSTSGQLQNIIGNGLKPMADKARELSNKINAFGADLQSPVSPGVQKDMFGMFGLTEANKGSLVYPGNEYFPSKYVSPRGSRAPYADNAFGRLASSERAAK